MHMFELVLKQGEGGMYAEVIKVIMMFVIRGDIFRSLGDPAMAIINYSQAIKLDDSDYMAFYNRAETYREVS